MCVMCRIQSGSNTSETCLGLKRVREFVLSQISVKTLHSDPNPFFGSGLEPQIHWVSKNYTRTLKLVAGLKRVEQDLRLIIIPILFGSMILGEFLVAQHLSCIEHNYSVPLSNTKLSYVKVTVNYKSFNIYTFQFCLRLYVVNL